MHYGILKYQKHPTVSLRCNSAYYNVQFKAVHTEEKRPQWHHRITRPKINRISIIFGHVRLTNSSFMAGRESELQQHETDRQTDRQTEAYGTIERCLFR